MHRRALLQVTQWAQAYAPTSFLLSSFPFCQISDGCIVPFGEKQEGRTSLLNSWVSCWKSIVSVLQVFFSGGTDLREIHSVSTLCSRHMTKVHSLVLTFKRFIERDVVGISVYMVHLFPLFLCWNIHVFPFKTILRFLLNVVLMACIFFYSGNIIVVLRIFSLEPSIKLCKWINK